MKKKTLSERFDSVSAEVAKAMRTTFLRYRSLTDSLADVQRGVDTAKGICQSLYRTIDGPYWEILASEPKYRTDEFIQALYNALTNTSIRKWTRQHLALVNESKAQLDDVSRKANKLRERYNAYSDKLAAEAKTTAVLLNRMAETREALIHRIEFTVKKFLEIRLCILKTLTGTSEMIFLAAGEFLTKDMLEAYSAPSRKECNNIVMADESAVRNGKKRK